MNNPSPFNTPERQRLMQRYHALEPVPKSIVQLLAVAYEGIARDEIQECFPGIKVKEAGEACKTLLSEGLIYDNGSRFSGSIYQCHHLIVEPVTRELARDEGLKKLVTLLQKNDIAMTFDGKSQFLYYADGDELAVEIRHALYLRDYTALKRLATFSAKDILRKASIDLDQRWRELAPLFAAIADNPYDQAWLLELPQDIINVTIPEIMRGRAVHWHNADDPTAVILAHLARKGAPPAPASWHHALATLAILRGDFARAEEILNPLPPSSGTCGLRGWLLMLRQDYDAAQQAFQQGLTLLRKELGKRKVYYSGVLLVYSFWTLLLRDQPGDRKNLKTHLSVLEKEDRDDLVAPFAHLLANKQSEPGASQLLQRTLASLPKHSLVPLWAQYQYLLAATWFFANDTLSPLAKIAGELYQRATEAGYTYLAAELAATLATLQPNKKALRAEADAFQKRAGIVLLQHRLQREEPWERALHALSRVADPAKAAPITDARLVWCVRKAPGTRTGYLLEPREQKRGRTIDWTKGTALTSGRRLKELVASAPHATSQDRQAAQYVQDDTSFAWSNLDPRLWLALVGHPLVFLNDNYRVPVEVVTSQPTLVVKSTADKRTLITLTPKFTASQTVIVETESPSRLRVIAINPEHHQIASLIGNGLHVPQAARERIIDSLSTLASLVTIHSDIGGIAGGAEQVAADATPRLHLLPDGAGLRAEILIRPFRDRGPYYSPGHGVARIIAEVEGQVLQAERDLEAEGRLADRIVARCPTLGNATGTTDRREWLIEDPEECLQLLLEVQDLGAQDEPIAVEWPKGQPFALAGCASLQRFRVEVRREQNWFALSGDLTLDDGSLLDMQRLLALTEGLPGNFIRLDDGRFLALTHEFKKRLQGLRLQSEVHRDNLRLPLTALPSMETVLAELPGFRADADWDAERKRLQKAMALRPAVPTTLQAELRDYQVDGFRWLARLAAWGAGACLADDMGLGKTLQALALLLARASKGPALVIAPTSVCMNWIGEAARFAPTLQVRYLGTGDRQKTLEDLQPRDLVICSYGLLQQEATAELLAQTHFHTIVLDEAQAIKNIGTKRSQAAMALQSDFKLITTGTQLEYHLGEMWNLFRFINPGLIGSQESFNRRFATPIDRDNDPEARQALKRLIKPFMLRRTKTQVLEELPPRTDIQLQVELNQQEMTLYEALRRRAVDELHAETEANAGEKHLRILAALTKLRRACCHSTLVLPEADWPSSKLTLFGDVLTELLDNKHKVLVFSQFIDYLALIRAYLDERKISYQYLDGQTPALERKQRVEAFQSGQGDVFLISLKAGGTGLNLTAADYVIHMDPWWNPAVEDQASDRAHRIGQERPVTVYRLVTANTIEEKIVAMHARKRDLADSVLEGTDMAGKLKADDLLRLIAEH